MLDSKAVHHRKSEARATPDFLSRKEWFYSFGQGLGAHANPAIGNLNSHVATRLKSTRHCRGIVSGDRDNSAIGHRISRIDNKIENCEFNLIAIQIGRRERTLNDYLQFK